MTPHPTAPDRERPRRLPIVIGSAVAFACIAAGVASAQTVDSTEPAPTTDEVAEELQADPEASATEPAADEGNATEDPATNTAEDEVTTSEQRKGNRLRLEKQDANPGKVFWKGVRKARLEYKFVGARTADLRIEIWKKRSGDDRMIRRYNKENVESDKLQVQRWNGRNSEGSHVKRANLYWVVAEVGGKRLSRKRASGDPGFRVFPAKFPVEGKHSYWDGWGAGRGHQGQDVGAKCGTPLVAAEPGKVVAKAYDGGGWGYYVIVKVAGKKNLYEVYSHMKSKARVNQGSRVKTGERIGQIGESGNASGCHVHFEYRPDNVPSPRATKLLKRWDSWS